FFTSIFIPPHYYTAFFSSIREKGHLSVTFFDRLSPPFSEKGGLFCALWGFGGTPGKKRTILVDKPGGRVYG
ncbi:hypothetical protein, partial [Allofournierella massiliensis]